MTISATPMMATPPAATLRLGHPPGRSRDSTKIADKAEHWEDDVNLDLARRFGFDISNRDTLDHITRRVNVVQLMERIELCTPPFHRLHHISNCRGVCAKPVA